MCQLWLSDTLTKLRKELLLLLAGRYVVLIQMLRRHIVRMRLR